MSERIDVSVWRGSGARGLFERFEVPAQTHQTVLDVVAWIQANADPTLSYRFACRVGMCGSCGMMVNGKPRWTCRTRVDSLDHEGRLEISPLRNLPVIKDLAVDMDPFFDKWVEAEGVFHPGSDRDEAIATIRPDTPERQEADRGIECINCGICYAACDTVTANPSYLGPAALNRAWTLYNDARDSGAAAIMTSVTRDGGCMSCHAMGNCTWFCPNGLDPMRSIAGLKKAATLRVIRRNG